MAKAKKTRARGAAEPVAIPAETVTDEEKAQNRVNNAIRSLAPQLDAQIAEIERRLDEMGNRISAIGNSIHQAPANTNPQPSDKYYHRGGKSTDTRAGG